MPYASSMPESTRATRWIAGCALAGVSLIAAVVSYLHALAVARAVGATPPVSYLIPFLADLVILGASAALLDAARRRHGMPLLVVVSLAAGVGVTLAMNVAAGWHHGAAGALVAGWPAVAFILALESLAGMVRRSQEPARAAVPDQCAHVLPADASQDERIVAAFEHARDCLHGKPYFRAIGRQLGVHHATVAKAVRKATSQTPAGALVPPPNQTAPAGPALNGASSG